MMDANHFDHVARSLSQGASRRGLLRLFPAGGAAVAYLSLWGTERASAKLKRNKFGCVDVGNPCRGRDQVCCSGICKGKKPKKGEKDKSRCAAHNAEGCKAEDDSCSGVETTCITSTGQEDGFCHRTTGNAGYCAHSAVCFKCSRDVECEPICGLGAMCGVCQGNCPETDDTECFGLGPGDCTLPEP